MFDKDLKLDIINAARLAVKELIKVAKEPIVTNSDDDLSADKLKSAAQAKRIAIEDAFTILSRIEEEESSMKLSDVPSSVTSKVGFAERRSK
jgi:hypothetical protein